MGIVFGTIPQVVANWLIEPAVRAFHWTTEDIKLNLYHGINEPLLLSILTLGLGTTLYLARRPVRQGLERVFGFLPVKAERIYIFSLDAIAWIAKIQTRILQNGSLHRYLAVIIGSATVGIGLPFLKDLPPFGRLDYTVFGQSESLLVLIIAAAVVIVVWARSRLLAICSLGVIGAGIALLFLIFGAPDVALTQLLIETLTVIIVSLVLLRLPRLEPPKNRKASGKLLNFGIATATGALITALILAVIHRDLDRYVTEFFEANSYIAAHGRNIVNVILVDFRSMDTLGEITVVAIAGLAAYALIRTQREE
jgi:multicomponent Na+:H+ antiporter subunit A